MCVLVCQGSLDLKDHLVSQAALAALDLKDYQALLDRQDFLVTPEMWASLDSKVNQVRRIISLK